MNFNPYLLFDTRNRRFWIRNYYIKTNFLIHYVYNEKNYALVVVAVVLVVVVLVVVLELSLAPQKNDFLVNSLRTGGAAGTSQAFLTVSMQISYPKEWQ